MENFKIIFEKIITFSFKDIKIGKIILILLTFYVIYFLFKKTSFFPIKKILQKTYRKQDPKDLEKRVNTLFTLLLNTGRIIFIFLFLVIVLPYFGIDIKALLAGVGIFGLAISFGAQSLVKDIISGTFIIIEDQYRIGDWINIQGQGFKVEGKVEDLSLRRTVLRDLDGIQHVIPHSAIRHISNITKGLSRIDIDLPLSLEVDIEKAQEIIDKIGEELVKDSKFGKFIKEPPKVLGIEKIGEGKIVLKILGTTIPGEHWETGREFKKRIFIAFKKEGITIK